MLDDYAASSTHMKYARRPAKNSLAVRMFVAKLAWLDGSLYWRDDHIAWVTPDGDFSPEARDLSRAQKTLNKLAQFRNSAPAVLGDSEEWIRIRRERLELAKRLHVLHEADIAALVNLSTSRDAYALRRLADLIPAEALCFNSLPASPSRALILAGASAENLLRALIADHNFPPCVASLAAVCLGAISARHDFGTRQEHIPDTLRRSYDWGRQHGLPEHPGLAARILLTENGDNLARRCLAALNAPAPFALSADRVSVLIAERGAVTGVAIAEAATGLEPIVSRLFRYRDALPAKDSQMRESAGANFAAHRRLLFDELANLSQQYLLASGQPTVVHCLGQFLESLNDLVLTPDLWRLTLVPTIQAGLDLPCELYVGYLTVLTEGNGKFWSRSAFPNQGRPDALSHRVKSWLHEVQNRSIQPLLRLFSSSKSVEVAREAVRLDIYRDLSRYDFQDFELYHEALEMVREFGGNTYLHWSHQLCSLLNQFGTAKEAREAFHPIVQALKGEPFKSPGVLFQQIIWALESQIHYMSKPAVEIATVCEYVTFSLSRLRKLDAVSLMDVYLFSAVVLGRSLPGIGKECFIWLLDKTKGPDYNNLKRERIPLAVRIAAQLAGDSAKTFQEVFTAAVQLDLPKEYRRIVTSLAHVGKFPEILALLKRVFPRQPKRCLEVIARFGLTRRLGQEVIEPLAFCSPQITTGETGTSFFPVVLCRDAEWRRVIAMLPDSAAHVAAYQHARWLLKEPAEVTPGIRNVLNQPSQWATEFEHINTMIAEQPHRSDLIKRAERLKTRIEDTTAWEEQACTELKERLSTVTDAAQIRALESLVDQCFFNRLKIVVGPLPEQTRMTPDLLNATLLTADVTQNKKLLQKLLRAHLFGPKDWRERHPANAAFLKSLSERGVDADAWLSEHPRRYACADVPGGHLHLRLERNPLHILQMGNYFGTCLSLDGGNAFSTIANACELNKRVIYARDANGLIVGRQLIGLNEEGKLIGFRVYASLGDGAGNKRLSAVFLHYAQSFAVRCGLTLADTGTVPKLFAEAWYDDGVVPWGNEETATPIPSHQPP